MDHELLTADKTVDEVLALWPQTVSVFRHYAEACVGCSLAPFCTVEEAAAEYNIPVEKFVHELQSVVIESENVEEGEDN